MSETSPGISRRTLVKGTAWAVPAVAVAAAAPAMAASVPPPCIQYSLAGTACKWPGSGNNWSYHLVLKICNKCTTGSVTVNFSIGYLQNNSEKPLTPCSGTGLPITVHETIAQGACVDVLLGDFSSESSASKIQGYDVEGGTMLFEVSAPPKWGDCAFDNPCVTALVAAAPSSEVSEPTGTEPTGTEPTGTEPTGTEPTGTEPTGTESPAAQPTEP